MFFKWNCESCFFPYDLDLVVEVSIEVYIRKSAEHWVASYIDTLGFFCL